MSWASANLNQILLTHDSGVWGPEDPAGGVSVLRSTNMRNDGTIDFANLALRAVPSDKRKAKLLKTGDIILENSGGGPKQPVGRVCFFAGDHRDHVAGNFCRRLRANHNLVLPRFLFWRLFYLHSVGETERFQTQTIGIRNLQFRLYAQQEIELPSISEQRRIIEILDQADALRKRAREADVKAARILLALFLKMFGDPATNPMGWPIKSLGDPDVCEINPRAVRGLPASLAVSFVPMADVDERLGRIAGTQTRTVDEVKKGFTPFSDRDVLFAKITPCMQNGKSAIADNLVNGLGYGSTEFHVLRAAANVAPEWLFALVRLRAFRAQAATAFTGSAGQQRVPANFLKQYRVPVPDRQAMQRFASAAADAAKLALAGKGARPQMDILFSLLLERAFSGELTAKWRAAHSKELLIEMQEQARLLNLSAPMTTSKLRHRQHRSTT